MRPLRLTTAVVRRPATATRAKPGELRRTGRCRPAHLRRLAPRTLVLTQSTLEDNDSASTPPATTAPDAEQQQFVRSPAISDPKEKQILDFIRHKNMGHAESVFEEVDDPDISLVNRMLKGFLDTSAVAKCWSLLERLPSLGLQPDGFTYSIMMNVCALQRDAERAEALKTEIQESGQMDRVIYNSYIQVYVSLRQLSKAMGLLKEMESLNMEPDIVTYNTLMSGAARSHAQPEERHEMVQAVLQEVKDKGLELSTDSYRALIRNALLNGQLEQVEQYIDAMLKQDQLKSFTLKGVVIDLCNAADAQNFRSIMQQGWKLCLEAEKRFIVVPGDIFLLLMKLFAAYGQWASAFELLDIMDQKNVNISAEFYATLLEGLAKRSSLGADAAVVGELLMTELTSDRIQATPDMHVHMLQILLNTRDLAGAEQWLDKMRQSHVHIPPLVYNLFLDYLGNYRYITNWRMSLEKAQAIVAEMKERKLSVKLRNFASLLTICTKCQDFASTDAIVDQMKEQNLHPPLRVYASILQMCAKAKDPEDAKRAWKYFDQIKLHNLPLNVIHYTIMINVCDVLSDLEGGLRLAEEMKQQGIRANERTYTSLMHLAGHVGDVEALERIFAECVERGALNSTTYAVLINAYGKAGLMDKVLETVEALKAKDFKVDLTIFRNLIHAAADCDSQEMIYQFFEDFRQSGEKMDYAAYELVASKLQKLGDLEGAAATLELRAEERRSAAHVPV